MQELLSNPADRQNEGRKNREGAEGAEENGR